MSEIKETSQIEQTKEEILKRKISELYYIERLIYNIDDWWLWVWNSEIDKDYNERISTFENLNQKIWFVEELIEEYSNNHLNNLNIWTKEINQKYRNITIKYPNLEWEILSFLKKEDCSNPKKILKILDNLEWLLWEMTKSNDKNTNEIYISQFLEFYSENSFTDSWKATIWEKYKKIKESWLIEESLVNLYPILLSIPIEKLEKLKEITKNKKIEDLNDIEKKSYIDYLESDLQITKSYFKNFDEFSKEIFYKENKEINNFPEILMISFLDMNKENQDIFKNLLIDFKEISDKSPDIKEKFILDNMSKINTNDILELQKISAFFVSFNKEININDKSLISKNEDLIQKNINEKQNELLKWYPEEQKKELLNILNSWISNNSSITNIPPELALFQNKFSNQNNSQQSSSTEKPATTDKVNEISPKLKTLANKIEWWEKLVNFLTNENENKNENKKDSINIWLDWKIQVWKDDNLYYTNSLWYEFEFHKENSWLDKMFDTIDKMDYFIKIWLGYFWNNFKNMLDTIKDIVPSVSSITINEKEWNFLDNIEAEKILQVFKNIWIIDWFDVNNTKPNIVKDIEMDEKMRKINENWNIFYDKNTWFNKQNFKEVLNNLN